MQVMHRDWGFQFLIFIHGNAAGMGMDVVQTLLHTSKQGCLSRRVLTECCLEHVAHVHFGHFFFLNTFNTTSFHTLPRSYLPQNTHTILVYMNQEGAQLYVTSYCYAPSMKTDLKRCSPSVCLSVCPSARLSVLCLTPAAQKPEVTSSSNLAHRFST